MDQRLSADAVDNRKGEYVPIRNAEDPQLGKFDTPLPCFGCGIGWFSDPRERAGLAASAIAALICTIAVVVTIAVFVLQSVSQ
ncbi:60S ribosomal protein L18a-like protein [Quillaja saponaria]|uniref:60S ribosomal protein L18a-like protein n=1 Tax=Quillaja saponaria TaxID=32244 RepID=A0AAD7L4S6_QUISA|nr:60S ribosomal protein L18a-like protein [Quillaja saponaria]